MGNVHGVSLGVLWKSWFPETYDVGRTLKLTCWKRRELEWARRDEMSYWRVFRRAICLTYRYLVFYVECEPFAGRNESFPTSFPEISTTRLLFPRLRRKLLFSGFLSFVVKYSLHIRVIMSTVCVLADRTYSSSNTFSITTGRGSWNARFNFSPVQLERQQRKNNQIQAN